MTCNAKWPEIRQHMRPFDEVQQRRDLVARVFHAKVEIMIKRLIVDRVFGDIASLIYVVEYQKRGLPHAHFLLILKPASKLLTPEAYDRVVAAELPDKAADPALHTIVYSHMFHGPCGNLNPANVCMRNGRCKNRYPKDYCLYTLHGQQTYPQYRRRDTDVSNAVKVGRHTLDNRWIIPYNPRLLRESNCHMNVEICGNIRAVKYLYKYIYKGVDKVSMRIVDEADDSVHDEISTFQSARWISPAEAVWRIFSFHLCGSQPLVMLLQVHLPNFQTVRFSEEDNLPDLVAASSTNKTMLTEFFRINSISASTTAQKHYYKDFPKHYSWNVCRKTWNPRKRQQVVGRLASVNPTEGERYYLHLLLLNVKAPTSYDYLLLVDSKVCSNFREAANCRGLLLTDSTYETALEETASYQFPSSLRVLFATLLAYCVLSDPSALFKKFNTDLSDDFRRSCVSNGQPDFAIEQHVLNHLDAILETLGKSVNTFQLASTRIHRDFKEKLTREIQAELDIPVSLSNITSIDQLNCQQKEIYDAVLAAIYQAKPAIYFVDGPGGTRKTFLYKQLLAKVRSEGDIAIASASSGIAATLLLGGRTSHSRFGIPIASGSQSMPNISKASSSGLLLIRCKLIIWDEAPMINKAAIEAINMMLQDFCETDLLFSGKVVVFGGDFHQTLPIIQGGSRADTIDATVLKSYLWKHFKVYRLEQNMRAQLDPEFASYLTRIGDGTEPQTTCGRIRIPHNMALINEVYPDLSLFETHPLLMCSKAILTPKNDAVHEINASLIERFHGTVHIYKSVDRAISNRDEAHYTDFLNEPTPSGMPCHKLTLKLNFPVILLRNINPLLCFANGTRLICKTLDSHVIGVQILMGQFAGMHGFIPRITHTPREGDKYIIPFTRQQFPLRLAFAMTINKAQGQTLQSTGLFLRQSVFSHGQLYVALSRAKTSSSVKLLIGPPTENDPPTDLTINEVFKEILQLAAANCA